ncbi:plasmid mobilization protein [Pontibacter qinzhouensis]|nr:plasmid mobilization relaxosome protein MobC [Pontibacter qinzhouensis]
MEDIKKAKGGRPKLSPELKRAKQVKLTFSDSEYRRLEAEMTAAGHESLSVYLRKKALAQPDDFIANPKELIAVLDRLGPEISRVGNNINQVARYVNYLKANNMINLQFLADFNRHMIEFSIIEKELVKALRSFLRIAAARFKKFK